MRVLHSTCLPAPLPSPPFCHSVINQTKIHDLAAIMHVIFWLNIVRERHTWDERVGAQKHIMMSHNHTAACHIVTHHMSHRQAVTELLSTYHAVTQTLSTCHTSTQSLSTCHTATQSLITCHTVTQSLATCICSGSWGQRAPLSPHSQAPPLSPPSPPPSRRCGCALL